MFRGRAAAFRLFRAAAASRAAPRVVHASQRAVVATGLVGASLASAGMVLAAEPKVDYAAVKAAIEEIMDDENHDDGSWGPIFIRLAWHSCGTYDAAKGTGGTTTGGSMRFGEEAAWGANAGLDQARSKLETIKDKFPGISYGDLWVLAGVTAIEYMGGPSIPFTPGRADCSAATCPVLPDGLLPDASQGHQHLRDVFYRMGFNDQEIVALSGAHTLGRCHTTSSGFVNPWTNAPTTWSNLYFQELLNNTWTIKQWDGPEQYEDPTGTLMMLPTDMVLIFDPKFRKWVETYAKDEDAFSKDFTSAMLKLTTFGMAGAKPWYQFW